MRYECEVIIELPRERVIEVFDNPDNLPKWQEGLQVFEHFEGEEGRPGAKTRMLYDMNGREVEMIETIVVRDLPDEFTATYEAPGVWNLNVNHFYEDGPEKTRWVIDTEFKMKGLMMLMGVFMRGNFPKQTLQHMNDFKSFAESA